MPRSALLLLCSLSVLPAQGGRPLELQDYYRVETASAPAISPDGARVAFVRSYIIEAENRHNTEIWLSPADASAPAVRITEPSLHASAPGWSPDGKLLAFSAHIHGQTQTWFLRPGETTPFQIEGVDGTPIFSPDNQWIAFTKKAAAPPPAAATTLEQRFHGRIYDWMNFRFDGRGYLPDPRDPAASPASDLFIVPRQGGRPKRLTELSVDVQTPVWSPDSKSLALIADSHQRDEYSYERADVWVVDLSGRVRRLTDDGYDYDSPAWSPDGRSLVFRRKQSLNQIIAAKQKHGGPIDLYRLDLSGAPMRNLTPAWDLIPENPEWSGDGEFIYFAAAAGGDTHLFRLTAAEGTRVEQIPGERSSTSFSFSHASNKIAYIGADATHPPELFSSQANGAGERKLSALNDAWLLEVQLNRTERIHYPSLDGTAVEAYVTLPKATQPRHKYPLVLSLHGGPHGAFGSAFSFEFQWLAANGYAVVAPNPRGSTGYGEKFLWGSWGGWGKLDAPDVLSAVDYVVAHYPADPQRLAITGYSYGGFLTDWILTKTDRFAAAVSGAGVTNWISDYGTADIPRTKESEFYLDTELMRELSPVVYAAKIKTPVLFLHGESDLRVPIEEAEQLYTILKKHHVPAKFIRYPGDSHVNWPPWDMVHRYDQEVQWFNHYLHA